MSEVQVDTALLEGENLPVWPDTGLEDMELGIGTLGSLAVAVGLRAWGSWCRSEVGHLILFYECK